MLSALKVTHLLGFIWDEWNGIYSCCLQGPHSESTGVVLVWKESGAGSSWEIVCS